MDENIKFMVPIPPSPIEAWVLSSAKEKIIKKIIMIIHTKLSTKVLAMCVANMMLFAGALGIEYKTPHVVAQDGSLTTSAYTITAGDEQTVLVSDKKTARQVVKNVIEGYVPEGCKVNKIELDKEIKVEEADISDSEYNNPKRILSAKEAENKIVEKNSSEDPYFSVAIDGTVSKVEEVKPKTVKKETQELLKGETEVAEEGEKGSQVVIEDKTIVNGEVTESEVSNTVVLEEVKDKVVKVGTREEEEIDALEENGEGDTIPVEVLGEDGDGSTIAEFATKFVGNPYKWGGTSLTNGADCSGFVYAVYKHFGIAIPRVGAEKAGKHVSLDSAKPGDIIKYPGHYAMYIGNGKIVHAYNSRAGICISGVHAPGHIKSITRIVE